MKKILILASRPLSNDGLTKIEMDVYRKYKNCAKFEFACSFGFDNKYGDELKEDNVELHILPSKKKVLSYMNAINKLVKKREYDIVYVHGNSAMMFFDIALVKFNTNSKVITHCHNTKSNYPIIHYMLKPIFNRLVDIKIGCSIQAAKWAYCGKNIVVIPNGIDVEKMNFNIEKRKIIREHLGLKDETIIGHVGRFIDQKNHTKIINIFKEYLNIESDSKLILIGDGPDKNKIKQMAKNYGILENIIFIDNTDEVQNYYSAMDVFLMPSLFEGFCLVALEAQANGLPLVISDTLTKETAVTSYVKICSLKSTDKEWAKVVFNSKISTHYTPSKEEKEKMDFNSMMNCIGNILLA